MNRREKLSTTGAPRSPERTWAEKMGDLDFLLRGATNTRVCGFH